MIYVAIVASILIIAALVIGTLLVLFAPARPNKTRKR